MILAIDPSSTRTGYCVLDPAGDHIIDAGLLKPRRTRDQVDERIDAMIAELAAIRSEFPQIAAVVIEDTTGKVSRRHGGGGAGLAQYGKAIRAFRDACRSIWGPTAVHMVLENEWTRGRSKARRAMLIGATIRGDTGLDAADAIGLAKWWRLRHSDCNPKPPSVV